MFKEVITEKGWMVMFNKINAAWCHFKTITQHKILVMKGCFRLGLYWQGLVHDLSKYSPTEFKIGIQYFQGNKSPNAAERDEKGYSEAWLHHKGRNKHHYEYWTDVTKDKSLGIVGVKMPLRYVAEMFVDRVSACKIYQKDQYTDRSSWEYYKRTKDYITIHPETRRMLEHLIKMLAVRGEEETYRYIKYLLRVKKSY